MHASCDNNSNSGPRGPRKYACLEAINFSPTWATNDDDDDDDDDDDRLLICPSTLLAFFPPPTCYITPQTYHPRKRMLQLQIDVRR